MKSFIVMIVLRSPTLINFRFDGFDFFLLCSKSSFCKTVSISKLMKEVERDGQ